MRTLLCIFGIAVWANTLPAQAFAPTPGPVLQQEIAFDQANECILLLENLSPAPLTLRWRRVEVNMPEDWSADLCDYGWCYNGIPGNGIMQPVGIDTMAYLKLIVQPGATAGSAWIWFRVWPDGDETHFADVYFSLHTPGTVGASSPEPLAVRIYPNPASETLFLENSGAEAAALRLFDAQGRLVRQATLPGASRDQWPAGELPAGRYWLTDGRRQIPLVIQH